MGDNIVPCNPANLRRYPGCPIPDGGLPEGGILEDGGHVLSTYGGYAAHAGYDLASGLGSVDAAKLVAAWVGLTPTTTALTAPATAAVGTPVALSATITSTSATNPFHVSGTVTFAFYTLAGDAGAPYSFDAGGGPDESWVLGTVNVVAVPGSPEKATAALSVAIPPGIYGQAYLVAEYSGDTRYLASNSSPASFISVTGSTLQVVPSSITVAPNGQATFAVTGGAPPVVWSEEGTDTSCLLAGRRELCSQVEATSPTTAAFVAGGQAGSVTIVAIDTLGEEAVVAVTVAGTPLDAGGAVLPPVDDAGSPGGPTNPGVPFWDGGVYPPPSDDAGSHRGRGEPFRRGPAPRGFGLG